MQLAALCLASLALLSRSITVAALPGAVVDKRDIEINYLVNCQAPYKVSHIAWYSNLNNSQAQQIPDSLSQEYRDWSKGGDYLIWEGQTQIIFFANSNTTLQTEIDADAASKSFTSSAGRVQRTSDGKVFPCYKDDGRLLFSHNGLTCQSIYYCA